MDKNSLGYLIIWILMDKPTKGPFGLSLLLLKT